VPDPWLVEGLHLARPRLHVDHLTGGPAGVTVVAGPNGAGKTTLLRVLAGILPVTTGRVRAPADRAFVASPPPWFHPDLSVAQNLRFLTGVRDRPRLVPEEILAGAGVAADPETRFGSLSDGEQARVALAAELAHPPGLLLVDEALRSVDAAHRAELATALVRLAAGRTQVVLVDHGAAALGLPAGTPVVHLDGGRIVGGATDD
jgi:ABC-type multidrug transport system ATPase subunit